MESGADLALKCGSGAVVGTPVVGTAAVGIAVVGTAVVGTAAASRSGLVIAFSVVYRSLQTESRFGKPIYNKILR